MFSKLATAASKTSTGLSFAFFDFLEVVGFSAMSNKPATSATASLSSLQLKEAVALVAGLFDIAEKPTTSKKSKKAKESPVEVFDAAVASFENIGIETDARN